MLWRAAVCDERAAGRLVNAFFDFGVGDTARLTDALQLRHRRRTIHPHRRRAHDRVSVENVSGRAVHALSPQRRRRVRRVRRLDAMTTREPHPRGVTRAIPFDKAITLDARGSAVRANSWEHARCGAGWGVAGNAARRSADGRRDISMDRDAGRRSRAPVAGELSLSQTGCNQTLGVGRRAWPRGSPV
jgi:hypothetical protein